MRHVAMTWIWALLAAASVLFGAARGTMGAVSAAALEGAAAAVQLTLGMAGAVCLWSGVMELMERCGLSAALARLLRPVLRRLLPRASRDDRTLADVTANVSANLLGLGNAATPAGIRAARRMARRLQHGEGEAVGGDDVAVGVKVRAGGRGEGLLAVPAL